MKKSLLSLLSIATLGTSLSLMADFDYIDEVDGFGMQLKMREKLINSEFNGRNTIDLSNLFYGLELKDVDVKEVILEASTDRGNGKAVLLKSGREVSYPVTLATYMQRVPFRLYQAEDISNLSILLQGRFNVRKVGVKYIDKKSFRDQVVSKSMNRVISNSDIAVSNFLDLDRDYRGRKVSHVQISLRSQYRQAQISLKVNGVQEGYSEMVGPRGKVLSFEVPNYKNTIGNSLKSLKIDVSGEVYVESVSVFFEDGRRGNPPGHIGQPPRRIDPPREPAPIRRHPISGRPLQPRG